MNELPSPKFTFIINGFQRHFDDENQVREYFSSEKGFTILLPHTTLSNLVEFLLQDNLKHKVPLKELATKYGNKIAEKLIEGKYNAVDIWVKTILLPYLEMVQENQERFDVSDIGEIEDNTSSPMMTHEHKIQVLCTVWTDIEWDEKKGVILVKGYDYVRMDGSALLRTPQDDEWRKYDALYENWKSFRRINPTLYPNTRDGVLGWLNYTTYRKLTNELKRLKPTEEEDEKWKESGDADLKEVHGVILRDDLEIHSIRNDERKLLKQAINELEMLYRRHNLNAPDLELESQMQQMDKLFNETLEKKDEEIGQLRWDGLKQNALADWYQIELAETKEEHEKLKEKHEKLKDDVVSKAPLLFSEMTETGECRMVVLNYLRDYHGNIKLNQHDLNGLPKGVKQKARDFLMLHLGNNPKASDICDNVFKKPRRKRGNQDISRIGDASEENY